MAIPTEVWQVGGAAAVAYAAVQGCFSFAKFMASRGNGHASRGKQTDTLCREHAERLACLETHSQALRQTVSGMDGKLEVIDDKIDVLLGKNKP